jgi:hypothetical protein
MHRFETIQLVLWVLAPSGQVVAALLMIRQKLFLEIPWFFVYTLFHLGQFAVLFIAYHQTYSAYFYAYWIAEAIDILLVLAVIQEIYGLVFAPFTALRKLSSMIFRWAVITLFAISLLAAASASGTEHDRFIASLLILDRSAAFVECALVFLLFVLKQAIGLPWRNLKHGIALGLGVIAASSCVAFTVRAYSSQEIDGVTGLVLTVIYDLSIVAWIALLLRPEPVPDRAGLVVSSTLREWNRSLLELMSK